MNIISKASAVLLFALSAVVSTGNAQEQSEAERQLRESLAEMAPDLQITSISESVLPGVYEVVSNAQVYLLPVAEWQIPG